MKRTRNELIFIVFFLPAVLGFYLIYKYPLWFLSPEQVPGAFYLFGKSTSFWYASVYTALVCGISGWVVWKGRSPYGKDKTKKISSYQRKKFISIFFSQLIFFYVLPFIVPDLLSGSLLQPDSFKEINKDAYVYAYNGFTSAGGFFYVFLLVPTTVWFFGKRYCSWFCSCGNLAEVIGITPWGNKWVTQHTPRSKASQKLEWIQYGVLAFALFFGAVMLMHSYQIITADGLLNSLREVQDLVVDLMFGALIGIGAYPFLGTRIWCRYGCPLAGLMRIFGKFSRSKFKVQAHSTCKGLNLCSTQCPMGIDVASYAHKNGKPIEGSFGLEASPCIGCGGCVDICPVKALSFQKILNPKASVGTGGTQS